MGLKNKNENNTEKENEKENKNFIFNFLDFYLSKILFTNPRKAGQTLPNFLSFFGFLLLIFGFFRIREGLPYPGYWALVPTTGAILIILAGEKAYLNCKILKNTMAIFLGRISYPLYLWHWPLLVYLKIYYGEKPHDWILILCLLFSILLAYGTTILIENPLRFGKFNRLKVFGLSLVMVLIAAAAHLAQQNILSKRNNNDGWFSDVWNLPNHLRERGNRHAKHQILLFGDSHIHHFGRQLEAQLGNSFALNDMTLGNCYVGNVRTYLPAVWGDPPEHHHELLKKCNAVRHALKEQTPEIVITGNYARLYKNLPHNQESFHQTIMDKVALFRTPPKLMIFVGDAGEIDHFCEKSNLRRLKYKDRHCPPPENQQTHLDFIEFSQNGNFPPFVRFVYPFLNLCNKNGQCRAYEEDGKMNFWDNNHLTFSGGKKTVEQIAQILQEYVENQKE